MSVSYFATAALGFKLDPAKLVTSEESWVKGCKCPDPPEGFTPNFCPKCGAKWEEKVTKYKLIDEDIKCDDFNEKDGRIYDISSINGYPVATLRIDGSQIHILCLNQISISSGDHYDDIFVKATDIGDGDPDHFPSLYRKMIETLPRDLWDTEEGFQLWVGLTCG